MAASCRRRPRSRSRQPPLPPLQLLQLSSQLSAHRRDCAIAARCTPAPHNRWSSTSRQGHQAAGSGAQLLRPQTKWPQRDYRERRAGSLRTRHQAHPRLSQLQSPPLPVDSGSKQRRRGLERHESVASPIQRYGAPWRRTCTPARWAARGMRPVRPPMAATTFTPEAIQIFADTGLEAAATVRVDQQGPSDSATTWQGCRRRQNR